MTMILVLCALHAYNMQEVSCGLYQLLHAVGSYGNNDGDSAEAKCL
jgi:hypothetical protein